MVLKPETLTLAIRSAVVNSMRMSPSEFDQWPNKRVTLLGMSGVGKTRLASILRNNNWFHYSVDYRIGTRYLDEPILDNIKTQAMQVPFLRTLLMSDSIYISNNVTFENLDPLSTFLGKLGNPDLGGLPLDEFQRRQALHLEAELNAMHDVQSFIDKADKIYGYPHFLNDVSGSMCELDDPALFGAVAENTVMIYIEASKEDEEFLIERAQRSPKPLYYREDFLNKHLAKYKQEKALAYVADIDPDDFVRWVFPHLFYARLPRYQAIAKEYGYSVPARDAFQVETVDDFNELIRTAVK